MTVIFHNANGDSGYSNVDSIEPIQENDPVAPTATRRPSENLRLRTDILRYHQNVTEIAVAAPIVIAAEDNTRNPVNVSWDGPFVPGVGDTVPEQGTLNSGQFYLGTPGAPVLNGNLVIYPGNSVPAQRFAWADLDYGSILLRFETSAPAYVGNYMKVRVRGTLGAGTSPLLTWEGPDSNIVTQPAALAAVPALPLTGMSTLDIQIRADGTTTISSLKAALALSTSPEGYQYTLTSSSADSAAIPATDKRARLAGGIDDVFWYISGATLQDFFDDNLVNSTASQSITGSVNAQTVPVANVAGVTVGMQIHVGTTAGGDYEVVTVTAVNASPAQITGIFQLNHANGVVIKAAPNRMLPGDSVVVDLGNARERLAVSGNLSTTHLKLMRSSLLQQDSLVIPIASVPKDATRIIFANTFSAAQGKSVIEVDVIQLAGDLNGPGSTHEFPIVKRASVSQHGTVKLNAAPVAPDNVLVAAVNADGRVLGTGLSSLAADSTLSIGTHSVNDSALEIGHASGTAVVHSQLSFDFDPHAPGIDAASGEFTVGGAVASAVNLARTGTPTKVKGDLLIEETIDTELNTTVMMVGRTNAFDIEVGREGGATRVYSALKLGTGSSLDTVSGNDLVLGGTTSAHVKIGRTGMPITFNNKPTAPATVNGDGSTVLTTKGYVDALMPASQRILAQGTTAGFNGGSRIQWLWSEGVTVVEGTSAGIFHLNFITPPVNPNRCILLVMPLLAGDRQGTGSVLSDGTIVINTYLAATPTDTLFQFVVYRGGAT